MPAAVTGLSIDSRTIAPGEAYFAIKGDVHDGHDFVPAALEAGADCLFVPSAADRATIKTLVAEILALNQERAPAAPPDEHVH